MYLFPQLRQVPEIKYIEEETMAEAVQTTLPYHLVLTSDNYPWMGYMTPFEMEKVSIFIFLTQGYRTNTQSLEIEPSIQGMTQWTSSLVRQ